MTTIAISQPSSQSQSPVKVSALFKAGLGGGAIAAVANTALYGVTRLAGVEFTGQFDPSAPARALMPFQPAIASVVPSLFAALVMVGFAKLLKRPALPFAILAGVFTLASLFGPFGIPAASMGTKLALSAMHFVAAVAITVPLTRAVSAR